LTEQRSRWMEWFEIETVRKRLGLNLAALLLFAAACTCALGAILSGVVYRADTMLEWQAVQTWRIEWMLAAVVALLGALLLKKPAA
jgi:multisubunit Na+/H+ antiporter MnhB subunit